MPGVTNFEVLPVTVPTPWSMLRVVAPLVDHDNVADWPTVIAEGLTVNDEMTGAPLPAEVVMT